MNNTADIIENNKLIAQFMGLENYSTDNVIEEDKLRWVLESDINKYKSVLSKELKYDSDWNYLMPVIEKIEKLKIEDQIEAGFVTIWSRKDGCTIEYKMYESSDFYVSTKVTTTKIKAVYDTVVQFIKWYNLNKDKFLDSEDKID
jgi:hypothetical protein